MYLGMHIELPSDGATEDYRSERGADLDSANGRRPIALGLELR